jgi:DNA-directed RNA polymerase specialized sigma24 family protein
MRVTYDYDPQPCLPTAGEFYRVWRPKVAGMARNLRLIDHETVAEDVIVDFLASGYIERWDVTKGKTFDSFCFWMLRNKLYSALRSQKRYYERHVGGWEAEDGQRDFTLPTDSAYEQAEYEHIEQREALRALATEIEGRPGEIFGALLALEERDEDLRQTDVATALGYGATTTHVQYRRLREQLIDSGQDVLPVPL